VKQEMFKHDIIVWQMLNAFNIVLISQNIKPQSVICSSPN